jgi:DNA-binding response OmpR family regulator
MIVVVNDEPRVLESLARALRRDGHEVAEYEKGTDALEGAEWWSGRGFAS